MFTFRRGYKNSSLLFGIKPYTAARKVPRGTIYYSAYSSGYFQWLPTGFLTPEYLQRLRAGGRSAAVKPLTRMNVHFRDASGRFVAWDKIIEIEKELGGETATRFIKYLRELPAQ